MYCPKPNLHQWMGVVNQTLNSKNGIIQSLHHSTQCPYEECDRIVVAKKDNAERTNKTKDFLKKNGIKKSSGLWQNTCFSYTPNNNNAITLLDKFWDFYKKEEYTYRDQPLYAFMQNITGIKSENSKVRLTSLLVFSGKPGIHKYC